MKDLLSSKLKIILFSESIAMSQKHILATLEHAPSTNTAVLLFFARDFELKLTHFLGTSDCLVDVAGRSGHIQVW